MDENIPYMNSVKKLHAMLDAIQNAGIPETFNKDFLVDLGYTSSYDTALIKVLRYLGFLDSSNKPQDSYRQFVDHTKAKKVLGDRIRIAFDDLYLSDKNAHSKQTNQLKGWFKTKTGGSDAVAMKIASTFKSLADYAEFTDNIKEKVTPPKDDDDTSPSGNNDIPPIIPPKTTDIGLVYRFEIHLPDTQNVDTFRAIFKALREELMP
jgi:DNA-binding MarR family transcriptional regulator